MKNLSKTYKKTAVLLVNLGTPDSTSKQDIKKYLREFLSDRRVIEMNPVVWKLILNMIILPLRSKKTAKLYESIWRRKEEVSPLLYYTKRQAELLGESVGQDIIVDFAMRYGQPSIKDKLYALQKQGVIEIIILPLYPQYSATTTATVYDMVYQTLSKMRWQPNIIGVKPYYSHPKYIELLKQQVLSHMESLSFKPDALIVSFHGLPVEYFEKGDPYYCHCHKTYRLLKESLLELFSGDVILAFQSRFGPKKWLQPYITNRLEKCAKSGMKNVMVIAPGFASDCLETLEELKFTEKNNFLSQGGINYSVIPCLNDDKKHIQFLKQLTL